MLLSQRRLQKDHFCHTSSLSVLIYVGQYDNHEVQILWKPGIPWRNSAIALIPPEAAVAMPPVAITPARMKTMYDARPDRRTKAPMAATPKSEPTAHTCLMHNSASQAVHQ